MSSTQLSVEDVYKFYGSPGTETAVLRGVGFDVAEGEFVCVMGPSGSGKTTLLHLISGLDEPSSGDITVGGTPLSRMSAHERTLMRRDRVGYVFQFFNLLPNLTAFENVGLPIAIQGAKPSARAGELRALFERFGLERVMDSMPHQLSGGEMQRVSIARALAGGQPLLLCDEPTGNLSQKHGVEVMSTLRGVCDDDGKTVLLVTHNPRDAAFADRVLFLVDGEIDAAHALHGPDIAVEAVHESLAELHI
jgi:putative ABC transport system ATP-binding protein